MTTRTEPVQTEETITLSTVPSLKGQVGGKLEMSEDVVATIANLAASRVKGIHSLGRSGLLGFSLGTDPTRGVDAEVGDKQAALDLEVIIDYGCNIREVSNEIRQIIATEVHKMAGREVIEVNIRVTGIHMPEEEVTKKAKPKRRVQ